MAYSLLTTKFPHGALQAFLLTYSPSKQALPTDEYRSNPGEEFIYILEGELRIWTGDVAHDLVSGDSIYFNSNTKHYLENRTSRPTVVISMITPSIFNQLFTSSTSNHLTVFNCSCNAVERESGVVGRASPAQPPIHLCFKS